MIVLSLGDWIIEDRLLLIRFRQGSGRALCRIYEKYRLYLLKIASALLHDMSLAEDVVHEVFLGFAQSGDTIRLNGSLRSYLRRCVINRAKNEARANKIQSSVRLAKMHPSPTHENRPEKWIILTEASQKIRQALIRLPFEQREVIVLHLFGSMTFKEIATLNTVSMGTVQSRYRYGLDKLRSLLESEVDT